MHKKYSIYILNIFPIIVINILIMIFNLNNIIKEQIIQNNVYVPYFNTIYLLIVNLYFIIKTQKKYIVKNIIFIIFSSSIGHILFYLNWWIWINNRNIRRIYFFDEKSIYILIFFIFTRVLFIILIGLIIQIILLIINKNTLKKTNGT